MDLDLASDAETPSLPDARFTKAISLILQQGFLEFFKIDVMITKRLVCIHTLATSHHHHGYQSSVLDGLLQ